MAEYPSGNFMRDTGLVNVVRDALSRHDLMTPANISLLCSQQFGDTFSEVSAGELADCLAALDAAPAETDAPPEVEQPKEPPIGRAEANHRLLLATENLEVARRNLTDQLAKQKGARSILSEKVLAYQRGGAAPITREQLMRQEIAANQQEKMDRKTRAAQPPMRNPGPSVIDRSAFYSAQGDGNDFVRRQLRTGRHRGSVSLEQLGRMRADHAARATAKLPSQR